MDSIRSAPFTSCLSWCSCFPAQDKSCFILGQTLGTSGLFISHLVLFLFYATSHPQCRNPFSFWLFGFRHSGCKFLASLGSPGGNKKKAPGTIIWSLFSCPASPPAPSLPYTGEVSCFFVYCLISLPQCRAGSGKPASWFPFRRRVFAPPPST